MRTCRGRTAPGGTFRCRGRAEVCHSGARTMYANPQSRSSVGVSIWIPGPALKRRPGMTTGLIDRPAGKSVPRHRQEIADRLPTVGADHAAGGVAHIVGSEKDHRPRNVLAQTDATHGHAHAADLSI